MEICLFDKYLSDDNQKHLLKEFDQNEYAGYFVENAAFDIDFASDEYSKTMNLFLTIKNGFLTKHFVAFVDFLIETKVFDWKMKVVLIDEMSDNSRVSIEWLQELKKLYFSNLEIVAEVDVAEFDEKAAWWNYKKIFGQVLHRKGGNSWLTSFSPLLKKDLEEVCVIDGLFMAVHKKRITKTFDVSLQGFNFYDIDFFGAYIVA